MNRRTPFLLLSLFLLFTTGHAWAQFAQRGGLAGTVFDSAGAVVPKAQVTLLDVAQKQTRQLTADGAGHFEFDNLTAGQYQLTATLAGFKTETTEAISVNIGAITTYDF
jgi:hypothetical protein